MDRLALSALWAAPRKARFKSSCSCLLTWRLGTPRWKPLCASSCRYDFHISTSMLLLLIAVPIVQILTRGRAWEPNFRGMMKHQQNNHFSNGSAQTLSDTKFDEETIQWLVSACCSVVTGRFTGKLSGEPLSRVELCTAGRPGGPLAEQRRRNNTLCVRSS